MPEERRRELGSFFFLSAADAGRGMGARGPIQSTATHGDPFGDRPRFCLGEAPRRRPARAPTPATIRARRCWYNPFRAGRSPEGRRI